jgi:dihydrofolate reductase
MGRATCLSILSYLAKPLPDRTNIVLTDNPADKRDGFTFCLSIPKALEEAKKHGNKVYIMGGASVYKQFLPLATKLEITHIHKDFEGDCFFPEFNPIEWKATKREDHVGESFDFSFVTYEKLQ